MTEMEWLRCVGTRLIGNEIEAIGVGTLIPDFARKVLRKESLCFLSRCLARMFLQSLKDTSIRIGIFVEFEQALHARDGIVRDPVAKVGIVHEACRAPGSMQ